MKGLDVLFWVIVGGIITILLLWVLRRFIGVSEPPGKVLLRKKPSAIGKMQYIWIVRCWSCDVTAYSPYDSFTFKNELIEEGWQEIRGVWVCPRHVEEAKEIGIGDVD